MGSPVKGGAHDSDLEDSADSNAFAPSSSSSKSTSGGEQGEEAALKKQQARADKRADRLVKRRSRKEQRDSLEAIAEHKQDDFGESSDDFGVSAASTRANPLLVSSTTAGPPTTGSSSSSSKQQSQAEKLPSLYPAIKSSLKLGSSFSDAVSRPSAPSGPKITFTLPPI